MTSNGDGTLSARPDDDTIVSASVSGTTVHVTALKNGSTTIAITMSEGQNYTARTETIDVTARNTLLNVTVLGVDGSPMNNVQVSGLTGVSSEKTSTDENGKLMAVLEDGEYTISVPAMEGCIDATLHAQSVTLGENEEKSVTLQPVSNGTRELRITSTRKIKMSDNVESIDVFCVGGGGGGGGGNYVPSGNSNAIWGGGGGAGGHTTTSLNAPFTPYVEYDAIVGAGGKGGQGIFSSSSVTHGRSGNSGGKTSVLNCTALGGAGGDGGASADAVSSGTGEGGDGGSGGGGGDGGSPGASDTPNEGGAGGVDGADGAVGSRYSKAGKGQGKTTRAFGDPKGELFSSGGQGGAKTAGTAASNVGGGGGGGKSTWNNSGSGTDGKDGVILLRWRLKS